ncbi:unnamed protein product, partial [marine sediment metagenome]
MKEIAFKLRAKLIESVQKNRASGLLFSGGLDSAILATLNPEVKAITVSLINQATTNSDVVARFTCARLCPQGYKGIRYKNEGKDVKFATSLVRLLKIE